MTMFFSFVPRNGTLAIRFREVRLNSVNKRAAAKREVLEETGLHIAELRLALVQDSIFSDEFKSLFTL